MSIPAAAMAPPSTPAGQPAAFARHYDAILAEPWVADFYEDTGFFNAGLWTQEAAEPGEACEALVRRLAARLDPAARCVLDVGCGLGATTATLGRLLPGSRVVGANISARQLARARAQHAGPGFAVIDAARLACPDGVLDAIVCVEAAFHFESRACFFREARRALAPGGTLALADILFAAPTLFGDWLVPAANRGLSPGDYADQLRAAGFDEVEVVDATAVCWEAYCRALERWRRARRAAGRLTAPESEAFAALIAKMSAGYVSHYLLAWARRAA